jgi:hypothetical protein|tara:strand:- start:694 stop:900 length:207 start_codon:yes stop_codon:yes gene_type:complete
MISANDSGSILTVQQVCTRLWGVDHTETDRNRLYRMIKTGRVPSVVMGSRKFVPVWAVEKIERGELDE